MSWSDPGDVVFCVVVLLFGIVFAIRLLIGD